MGKLKNSSLKKSETKLPPVSVAFSAGGGENYYGGFVKDIRSGKEKLKKLGRISNKILYESTFVREQII